jgi:hypothetical protein
LTIRNDGALEMFFASEQPRKIAFISFFANPAK